MYVACPRQDSMSHARAHTVLTRKLEVAHMEKYVRQVYQFALEATVTYVCIIPLLTYHTISNICCQSIKPQASLLFTIITFAHTT